MATGNVSADRAHGRVVAVVQARMSSSRLPGKVLENIGGAPALVSVVDRLRRCDGLDAIVVAASVEASDDPIAALVGSLPGIGLYRGPLSDVLARFVQAGEREDADAVVRITADCPFVEPAFVDRLVQMWRSGEADYVSNVIEPRTFPKGLDAEVVAMPSLRIAAAQARKASDREHVTTWIRARPDRYPAEGLWLDPPMGELRVTLDTADDLSDLRRLADAVGRDPSPEQLLSELGGAPGFSLATSPPPGSHRDPVA